MAWGTTAGSVRPEAGTLRHRVRLENPAAPVPDGDGGFTLAWEGLEPEEVWAAIEPATVRNLERVTAGTVVSAATHLVTLRYHAGVTTKTRMTFGTRVFQVSGVVNPEERNLMTIALCTEVVP